MIETKDNRPLLVELDDYELSTLVAQYAGWKENSAVRNQDWGSLCSPSGSGNAIRMKGRTIPIFHVAMEEGVVPLYAQDNGAILDLYEHDSKKHFFTWQIYCKYDPTWRYEVWIEAFDPKRSRFTPTYDWGIHTFHVSPARAMSMAYVSLMWKLSLEDEEDE